MVGCFCADRAEEWDMFVIVKVLEDRVVVIFPRMKLIDNKIKLGVDKMTEPYGGNLKCECGELSYGNDCGCDLRNRKHILYSPLFTEVESEYEYTPVILNLNIYCGYMFVYKKDINYMDIPLHDTYNIYDCNSKNQI